MTEPTTETGRRAIWEYIIPEHAVLAIEAEAAEKAVTHCADMEHAAQERARASVGAVHDDVPYPDQCQACNDSHYAEGAGG